MDLKRHFILIFLFWCLPQLLFAANSVDGLWSDRENNLQRPAPATTTQSFLGQGRRLGLDRQALAEMLATIQGEDSQAAEIVMTLPLPDGRFSRFAVAEASVMAAELAAKYPNIKTYRGQGLDDPTATARFSLTSRGFHGMIISSSGTYYINPDKQTGTEDYISFSKQQRQLSSSQPLQCLVESNMSPINKQRTLGLAKISGGDRIRTYEIAIATTGEYAQAQGDGTVEGTLESVGIALTRINGIFERDVAVQFELVRDNDEIIFTDPAKDPYDNADPFALLDQNQTTLDNIIGTSNYDIGHVLSTAFGGVAALASTCDRTSKAAGTSGIGGTSDEDIFFVDILAHEIGHQFAANHTFNGNTGACTVGRFGDGNRNEDTAYEPGSGTTIMSYAGICDGQNVQPNSDDYFHGISLEEIITFIDDDGDRCDTLGSRRNTLPIVAASNTASRVFSIPKDTPFMLTGVGSDVDNDTLTYTWEQFDLGSPGILDELDRDGPLFRSFPPTNSPSRVFPSIAQVIDPDSVAESVKRWEVIPGTTRDLTFRLTARDNRGGINQDTLTLKVSGGRGPFQVLEPNLLLRWTGLETETVRWRESGTRSSPINCDNVNIRLSVDGGFTYPFSVLNNTENDGREDITVPNVDTEEARIKVECANNVFFDISDRDFIIESVTPPNDILNDNFDD